MFVRRFFTTEPDL